MQKQIFMAAIAAAAFVTPAWAQHSATAAEPATAVYAPYDWLVGNWSSKGGIREQVTYGPNNSYLRFSVFTRQADGQDHLHFGGIAIWNGKTKALDYLFAIEPGSGAQESGTFRAQADGSIVREIRLIDAKGAAGTFRQTFRQMGANGLVTSVMRKTEKGWEPTFPGSERIEMNRTRS